jgi:predicted ATPase/DNA-binding winged helix-turn-helix (wHTH) protein
LLSLKRTVDATPAGEFVTFLPFLLSAERKLLLENNQPVRLGSRALEILIVLVQNAGRVVTKDEIMAAVWPNIFVEDANLRVHISALRRALGDGQASRRFITNIPGRGYCFVAPIKEATDAVTLQTLPGVPSSSALPHVLTRTVGTIELVKAIAAELPHRRFVTLVGSGGIGKTTIALSVAEAISHSYRDGVRFIDLAAVGEPKLVPVVIRSALGVPAADGDVLADVVQYLRDRQMLVVLDSCEHVVDPISVFAERLHGEAPDVHLLTTSREPLRVQGERIRRVAPLEIPVKGHEVSAAEARRYSAIELFAERASMNADSFELIDADVPTVAEICRRLDGIPLAIELAAGRVSAFGVSGLAALLDDRFDLLKFGRRTALRRHHTLEATLDWSYLWLVEDERITLRRLAVFAGEFTLSSAASVVGEIFPDSGPLLERITSLVDKSLIAANATGAEIRYRLPNSTRAYALAKLQEEGEAAETLDRHARYFRDLFAAAEHESKTALVDRWVDRYASNVENVRLALDWAFSAEGDVSIGISLAVNTIPLWMHLSLADECRLQVERALSALSVTPDRDRHRELRLLTAFAGSLQNTQGPSPQTKVAWENARKIAESLNDSDYRLRTLWGLSIDYRNEGRHQEGLRIAEEFVALAKMVEDPAEIMIGERMLAMNLHILGRQADARQHLEVILSTDIAPVQRAHVSRYHFDQQLGANLLLATILWLQGSPDQGMRIVDDCVSEALATDHALNLCGALARFACPVALLRQDFDALERFAALLLETSSRHSLSAWHARGVCFEALRQSEKASGKCSAVRKLRSALQRFPGNGLAFQHSWLLGEFAALLAREGRTAEAFIAVNDALARVERSQERWAIPELLRIKANILMAIRGPTALNDAMHALGEAIGWARQQGTLSWELRCATDLAVFTKDHAEAADNLTALRAVRNRFTEGFATPDLLRADYVLRQT